MANIDLSYLGKKEEEEKKKTGVDLSYLENQQQNTKEPFNYLNSQADYTPKEMDNLKMPNFTDELFEIGINTEKMVSAPAYRYREARQAGEGFGDSLKAGYGGFKEYMSYPGRRLESRVEGKESPAKAPDWFDFFNDLTNLPAPLATGAGFGMSLVTDPKNYLSAGMSQLGEWGVKLSSKVLEGLDAAKNVDQAAAVLKADGIEEGSKLFKEALKAKAKGITFSHADNLGDQAKAGQRALVNLDLPGTNVKKPIIKGKKVYEKIDQFKDWTKRNPIGQELRKVFVKRPPGVSDTVWNTVDKHKHTINLVTRNAADKGHDYAKSFYKIIDKYDLKPEDVYKFGEMDLKDAPEEVGNLIRKMHYDVNEEIIKTENAMGLKLEPYEAKMQENLIKKYMPRMNTDEGKKALKVNREAQKYSMNNRKLTDDPFAKSRGKLGDLPVSKVNQLAKDGKLSNLLGVDFNAKFFEDNPVVAQTIRNIVHETKMENAKMLNEIIGQGLKTGDVVMIPKDGKVPKGFTRVGKGGVYENITKDYAFRPKDAEFLTGKLERKVPEEFTELTNIYRKGMQGWKKGNLLFGESWYKKNIFGNLDRMYKAGFKNPKTLGQAINVIKNKKLGKGISGTVKTARGTMSMEDLVKAAEERGIFHQGLYTDFQAELKKELGEHSLPKKVLNKGEDFGFGIHQVEEDITRFAMFLDQVKKGYDLDNAAKVSFDVLFPYGDITDAEKAFKHWVSPFYEFYRFNIPYTAKKMVQNPRSFDVIEEGRQAWNNYQEEKGNDGYLPGYQRDRMPLRTGEGKTEALASFLPQYELYNMFSSPLRYGFGKVNPIIQIISDSVHGKNNYTGQDTNFFKAAADSWKPTAVTADVIDAFLEQRNPEKDKDDPFNRSVIEVLRNNFDPTFQKQYSNDELKAMQKMEYDDLMKEFRSQRYDVADANTSWGKKMEMLKLKMLINQLEDLTSR